MAPKARHVVSITCEGKGIRGWTEYEVSTSMIEASASFSMRRPFDQKSWETLRRDARVCIFVDGTQILDGIIDKRTKRGRDGTFEIAGRDRVGRLVQESAPRINYQGLELTEAVRRLADPWFTKITLSDARNRKLRMGKGRQRVPTGNEPIVIKTSSSGAGKVQPGTMRWAVIVDIVSQAGLICWSSADGKELFVGKPNTEQPPSFNIIKSKITRTGTNSTCRDLIIDEDNGDRYSLIATAGTGGGTEVDFGIAVSSRTAVERDGAKNDGTGRDFIYPKRLLLPEQHFDATKDASEIAARERIRRDFRRTTYQAEMQFHGQWPTPLSSTIFAPNTVAFVTDEDFDPPYEDHALIYACTYRRTNDGETTSLEMVPTETDIVP